jgi:hypothetical protein
VNAVASLIAAWREEAALYRRRGLVEVADLAESFASDLAARVREWELEALTLEEAVNESGYSYSALQKKLASGELENVGSKGSPRVRRGELPKKGGREEFGIADQILLRRHG